jgi:hypothetical protein
MIQLIWGITRSQATSHNGVNQMSQNLSPFVNPYANEIDSTPTPTPSQPITITINPKLTFSNGLSFVGGFLVAGFLFFVFSIPVGVFILTFVLGALGGAIGN